MLVEPQAKQLLDLKQAQNLPSSKSILKIQDFSTGRDWGDSSYPVDNPSAYETRKFSRNTRVKVENSIQATLMFASLVKGAGDNLRFRWQIISFCHHHEFFSSNPKIGTDLI